MFTRLAGVAFQITKSNPQAKELFAVMFTKCCLLTERTPAQVPNWRNPAEGLPITRSAGTLHDTFRKCRV